MYTTEETYMNKNTDIIQLSQLTHLLLDKYSNVIGVQKNKNMSINRIVDSIADYYESIIECMPGNVYWIDKNGKGVGCNHNVLQMFGFTSLTEFKGLTFEEMGRAGGWLPAATQSFKQDTLEVIATGKAKLNIEEPPIPHSNGSIIYFLTSRVPLFDAMGAVVGVVGVSIDITERRQMEEKLRKAKEDAEAANRAKTLFLTNISHDIKTPLTGIISTTEFLSHAMQDSPFKSRIDNVTQSGLRLLELMNEVIDSARAESMKPLQTVVRFQVKKLVEDVEHLIKPATEHKSINLSVNCDENIPNILIGNRTYLYRVLLNLVANATKFTQQGEITISAKLVKEMKNEAVIKFIVQDSGMGIPKDKQAIIFERFSRLTPSYEGIYQGSGLGLSIVKQFIEEMQGEIYVESQEGKGSTFTCIIPFKKSLLEENILMDDKDLSNVPEVSVFNNQFADAKAVKEAMKSVSSKRSTAKILLVEDNLIAARAAKDILESLKSQVDTAHTGQEALNLFEVGKYDLIYMDLGLPDMDGCDVVKKIRLIENNAKNKSHIIALSAHVDEAINSNCINVGMDEVFTKPLMWDQAKGVLDTCPTSRCDP